MRPALSIFSLCAVLLALNSCTHNNPGDASSVGPWDANGNYIEGNADNPSKWRRSGGSVAANDLPPADATPLPTGKPDIVLPTATPKPTPTIARVEDSPRPTVRSSSSRSSSSRVVSSKPKTKPKPTIAKKTVKPKAKPAPKVVKHTVKRGDSLSSIARKYGTTVSALQKANNLSGTLIRDGKTLVVPRKK